MREPVCAIEKERDRRGIERERASKRERERDGEEQGIAPSLCFIACATDASEALPAALSESIAAPSMAEEPFSEEAGNERWREREREGSNETDEKEEK